MPSLRRPLAVTLVASLASLASLAACGSDPAAPPKRVYAVSIAPLGGVLNSGVTVQLRARVEADPGVDTTVRWTSVTVPAGTLTATGVLSTCYPGGVMTIVATSVADPTKSDTARATIGAPAPGWAFVTDIARPGASTPPAPADFVDPGSVNGDVELTVVVGAGVLAGRCRAVERVELRVAGAGRDSVFAVYAPPTPFTSERTVQGRLRTTALPNGSYVLGGNVYMTGLAAPEPIAGLRVTIRN